MGLFDKLLGKEQTIEVATEKNTLYLPVEGCVFRRSSRQGLRYQARRREGICPGERQDHDCRGYQARGWHDDRRPRRLSSPIRTISPRLWC